MAHERREGRKWEDEQVWWVEAVSISTQIYRPKQWRNGKVGAEDAGLQQGYSFGI
jgi:hypothetical protein